MKKVLCPKCDNTVTFNEQKYEEGRSLFFVCPHCGKKFSIQVNQAKQPTHPNMAISLFSKMHIATDSNYLFLQETTLLADVPKEQIYMFLLRVAIRPWNGNIALSIFQ